MMNRPRRDRSRSTASAPRLELVRSAHQERAVAKPFAGDPFMISSPTRAQTASAVRARVGRLIDCVQKGHVYDAVETFYAPNVEVGRDALAPMFGLLTPDRRSGTARRQLSADAEWRGFRVHGVGVNGDTSFIECSLDFVSFGGECFSVKQVAVAQWRDEKIVKECLIPKSR